jgi:LysM repeat protein
MADDAPLEPGAAETSPQPAAAAPEERAGEFERYALLAALTLVVLCLLVWDRWHDGGTRGPAPRPDRTLRVEIGGGDPGAKPPAAPPKGDAAHVSNDAPPKPQPPAPPPPDRTCTVKSGETLSDIAKRELGSASRAQELADLNGIEDPTRLKAGVVLKLPAK